MDECKPLKTGRNSVKLVQHKNEEAAEAGRGGAHPHGVVTFRS